MFFLSQNEKKRPDLFHGRTMHESKNFKMPLKILHEFEKGLKFWILGRPKYLTRKKM